MAEVLRLIEKVRSKHFANAPASEETLSAFEHRYDCVLPEDMRTFYLAANGAKFYSTSDPPYEFLPMERITRARVALGEQDTDACGPSDMFAFCDVRDGNYVSIVIGPMLAEQNQVIDTFHETFPDPEYFTVICKSFTDFLSLIIKRKGKALFWL